MGRGFSYLRLTASGKHQLSDFSHMPVVRRTREEVTTTPKTSFYFPQTKTIVFPRRQATVPASPPRSHQPERRKEKSEKRKMQMAT